MQIYLIRHGETAWSLSGQHTGVTDLSLTGGGEQEARALGPRLRELNFAHVLVSPRLRAHQTCTLAGFGATARVDSDLAEWDYGHYEGRRTADIHTDHPDWNIWRDGCPGGDSPAVVSARADKLLARLEKMQGSIALFSHGQFSIVLAMRWIGLTVWEGRHFTLHTASLSLLAHATSHPELHTINLWNDYRQGLPSKTRETL
jgi:probable phosphoglycerate mutase